MKKIISFGILSFLLIIIFLFTFLKTPEELEGMLYMITAENYILAAIIHVIFLFVIVIGLVVKRIRNFLFSALLLVLSGTATILSIVYLIPPNIIIFATFFILTVIALAKKELVFELSKANIKAKVIGVISLFFAFYYLHWVRDPLLLNALIYSPLGIVNCPTMLAFAGMLCLLKKPGSVVLEFFVASVTLYFGFFGVMRFGVYVDIVLIVAAVYLIIRLSSKLNYEKNF